MTLENYTSLQSNSKSSVENTLNSESLDPLVQGFRKVEDPLTDITKKDPLLLKAVTGKEMDFVLYVIPYFFSPPLIMKSTVMIPKPLCVTHFTGILRKILHTGQRSACITWSN